MACKDLIDDAKMGSSDMVFKEICLEILSRAKNVLTEHQFRDLTQYAAEKMKEQVVMTQATLP
jgi:hypothetical protein